MWFLQRLLFILVSCRYSFVENIFRKISQALIIATAEIDTIIEMYICIRFCAFAADDCVPQVGTGS